MGLECESLFDKIKERVLIMSKAMLANILLIVSMTFLLGVVLFLIYQSYYKYIRNVACFDYESLTKEKDRVQIKRNKKGVIKGIEIAVNVILSIFILTAIGFTIYTRISHNTVTTIPGSNDAYVTVETGSMSYKNKDNTYLEENNLNNQIKTFSLVKLEKLSSDSEISIYDVCAYRDKNKDLIIHRVVDIISVDGVDYYLFRGDANKTSDQYYLTREEIIYRYNGVHYDAVGRFISYIKSPVGIAAVGYAFIALLALEILEDKKEKFVLEYEMDQKWYQTLLNKK